MPEQELFDQALWTKPKKTGRVNRGRATNRLVHSAYFGTNDDVFPLILVVYVTKGAKIADVTYGKGVFWRNVKTAEYELWASDLKTQGLSAHCEAGLTAATCPTKTRALTLSSSIRLICTGQAEQRTTATRISRHIMRTMPNKITTLLSRYGRKQMASLPNITKQFWTCTTGPRRRHGAYSHLAAFTSLSVKMRCAPIDSASLMLRSRLSSRSTASSWRTYSWWSATTSPVFRDF